MAVKLTEILNLTGRLDDSPGDDNPRERFRGYLNKNLLSPAQARDFVEECLRNSGEQYNRALQDLINHIGQFLGFEIEFGRYQGVRNQIGFDGLWTSPTGLHIVVEVKTTDAYSIKTSTLIGYIDELISSQKIPEWSSALGLYVIGRNDPELNQLENAIVAERRIEQLRIISADSLLSLAELMTEFDLNHADILSILKPSGARIDHLIELITKLVSESPAIAVKLAVKTTETTVNEDEEEYAEETDHGYWITPVKTNDEETADECIQRLVGDASCYAFGVRTPGRTKISAGDWLCFYATGKGVVAHAQLRTSPSFDPKAQLADPVAYPYTFEVENAELYFDDPVIIDSDLRARLDVFVGRDPQKGWAWFVQSTRKISKHDFEVLTGEK